MNKIQIPKTKAINFNKDNSVYNLQISPYQTIHKALKDVFGYDKFRSNQEEIINNILNNKNTLALMPTGGGKSLCYQIPMIQKKGLGIVISPLISLMKDQVKELRQRGLNAETYNNSVSFQKKKEIIKNIKNNNIDILFLSPERFIMEDFQSQLKDMKISIIAVDEAHCISQWGNDFRESYLEIGKVIKNNFQSIPILALTATADLETVSDIQSQLSITKQNTFYQSFQRDNLLLNVVKKPDQKKNLYKEILKIVKRNSEKNNPGIIFWNNKNEIKKIVSFLEESGVNAFAYHAGLSNEERNRIQDKFTKENNIVIVATIAFGMGINKNNVRYIIHAALPSTLENYYQEIGRAGRDGLESETVLFYSRKDFNKLRLQIIDDKSIQITEKNKKLSKLISVLNFCEGMQCRTKSIVEYFGEGLTETCEKCDRCKNKPKTIFIESHAEKALMTARLSGETNGIRYLIDILHGNNNRNIIENEHDNLKTFGKGTDLSEDNWKDIFYQLIALGYLTYETEEPFGLCLTKKGKKALKNPVPIEIVSNLILTNLDDSINHNTILSPKKDSINKEWTSFLKIMNNELQESNVTIEELKKIYLSRTDTFECLEKLTDNQHILKHYREIITIFSDNDEQDAFDIF